MLRRRKLPPATPSAASSRPRLGEALRQPTSVLAELLHTSRRAVRLGFVFGACSLTATLFIAKRDNVTAYYEAYTKIPQLVSRREHHHQIPLALPLPEGEAPELLSEGLRHFGLPDPNPSVEPMLVLDARYDARVSTKDVVVISATEENDRTVRKLCDKLDARAWPEFIAGDAKDDDESEVCFVTFGARRAFGAPLNQLPFGVLHAIVMVQMYRKEEQSDDQRGKKKGTVVEAAPSSSSSPSFTQGLDATSGRFALYGYNNGKMYGKHPHYFLNDMTNEVDRRIFLYPDLTVRCSKAGARRLFEEMETRSQFDYRLASCNCFSPIVSAFNWSTAASVGSPEYGFTFLRYFRESLLITIPVQNNFGLGTASNPVLRPYVNMASSAINALVQTQREK
jgi:hypothetical protein